jgi:hypothetical protein
MANAFVVQIQYDGKTRYTGRLNRSLEIGRQENDFEELFSGATTLE